MVKFNMKTTRLDDLSFPLHSAAISTWTWNPFQLIFFSKIAKSGCACARLATGHGCTHFYYFLINTNNLRFFRFRSVVDLLKLLYVFVSKSVCWRQKRRAISFCSLFSPWDVRRSDSFCSCWWRLNGRAMPNHRRIHLKGSTLLSS